MSSISRGRGRGRGRVLREVRNPSAETLQLLEKELECSSVFAASSPNGNDVTITRGRGSRSPLTKPEFERPIGRCLITSSVPAKRTIPLVSSSSYPTSMGHTAAYPTSMGTTALVPESDDVQDDPRPAAAAAVAPAASHVTAENGGVESPAPAVVSSRVLTCVRGFGPDSESNGVPSPPGSPLANGDKSWSSLPPAAVHAQAFIPQRHVSDLPLSRGQAITISSPKSWNTLGESSKVALRHLREVVSVAVSQPLDWMSKLDSLRDTMASWIATEEALLAAVRFVIRQAMEHETFALNGARLLVSLFTVRFKDAQTQMEVVLPVCVAGVVDDYQSMLHREAQHEMSLNFAAFVGYMCSMLKDLNLAGTLSSSIVAVLDMLLASQTEDFVVAACNLLKKTGDVLLLAVVDGSYEKVIDLLSVVFSIPRYSVATHDLLSKTLSAALSTDWEKKAQQLRQQSTAGVHTSPVPFSHSPAPPSSPATECYHAPRHVVSAAAKPYTPGHYVRHPNPGWQPRRRVPKPASMTWIRPSLSVANGAASPQSPRPNDLTYRQFLALQPSSPGSADSEEVRQQYREFLEWRKAKLDQSPVPKSA